MGFFSDLFESEEDRKKREKKEQQEAIATIAGGAALLGGILFGVKALSDNQIRDKILILGETQAGKDTLFHILNNEGFKKDTVATAAHKVNDVKLKSDYRINIINTSGSESTYSDTEKAKELDFNILCYVFNAENYNKNMNIKYGLQNAIEEAKFKGAEAFAIGTRGKNINNISEIENDINKLGIKSKIFELSDNPREEIIKFLFSGKKI
ncbi:hypothetical protein [Brachyspira hampsonii]|uniref:Uncharacterized protein n=1 Tax=Brachyspira hampsonii TaxID=1287055 RepID=A0AAC9TR92_9SPIR|nr:hypothetical protein [Brachyspira hampsonii]ASJ20191.1 hypothetical protein BHAMNSH16_00390 [Brachyspira hampsonii]ELV05987.1 hypothetical protein H263_06947 [Brachyspira hampsonii 30599]OEJ17018.1 hypothetical protein A9496_11970 [Brachyspira hampsonii]